jgi:hypothetical protein
MKTETKAYLEGFKAAGFKSDSESNHLNMFNSDGVSLGEFLSTIGFTSKEVIQTKRTWVEWTKEGVDFQINHRLESEKVPDYATVDFIAN